jgi:phytoene dehydrogenase-like protein
MGKSISIIGAGIAGLSAGCYGQMNGYQTQIFEMHNKPGGLVTSWERKGFNIQGGFQGLAGSSAANPFHAVWSELLDINSISFVDNDLKDVFEFNDGRSFYLYSNLDRLEEYMKGIALEDSELIDEFINGARRLRRLRPKSPVKATGLNTSSVNHFMPSQALFQSVGSILQKPLASKVLFQTRSQGAS